MGNDLIQTEHDAIVAASASTYSQLVQQGYRVSTNFGSQHNQFVGTDKNRLYPDIIVWKPNENNPTTGTAIIIEEIEMEGSRLDLKVDNWKQLADLGISKFILLVAKNSSNVALNLIQSHQINVSEIWNYEKIGSNFYFNKYFSKI